MDTFVTVHDVDNGFGLLEHAQNVHYLEILKILFREDGARGHTTIGSVPEVNHVPFVSMWN